MLHDRLWVINEKKLPLRQELSNKINNMDHDLDGEKLEGFIETTEKILDFIDEMDGDL